MTKEDIQLLRYHADQIITFLRDHAIVRAFEATKRLQIDITNFEKLNESNVAIPEEK